MANANNAIYPQVTLTPPATYSLSPIYVGGALVSPNGSGQYVFKNVDNSYVAALLSQGWNLSSVS